MRNNKNESKAYDVSSANDEESNVVYVKVNSQGCYEKVDPNGPSMNQQSKETFDSESYVAPPQDETPSFFCGIFQAYDFSLSSPKSDSFDSGIGTTSEEFKAGKENLRGMESKELIVDETDESDMKQTNQKRNEGKQVSWANRVTEKVVTQDSYATSCTSHDSSYNSYFKDSLDSTYTSEDTYSSVFDEEVVLVKFRSLNSTQ